MCAFKNCESKTSERPTILYPCPAPKRLLTSSNWISRNDSSNVDAILHPETYLVTPRLKQGEKTKGNVIEKHILSRNNCYCRCKGKKVPKPTFFKRPNTCVSYEGASKGIDYVYEDDFKRQSLVGCVCINDDDLDVPESLKSRLARLRKSKSISGEVGLKFSDQRKKYNEYRAIQQEEEEERISRFRDREKCLCSGHDLEGRDSEEVNTILGTQKYGTGTSTTDKDKYGTTSTLSRDKVSDSEFPMYSEYSVPDFRREHYFETHDIGKLYEITGNVSKDHACIHQFKLDQRWSPEPVNKDTFGRSLCKICDKPMEGSSLNLSTGYFSSEDSLSKSKLKNYAESYKSGLMPKTINMSRGKSKIELVLKDSDIAELSVYINKFKQPVYCNSLALRQQRMRLI